MKNIFMKNKITDELIDLGLPLHGKSFEYWLELLLAEYNGTFNTPSMMRKYSYLAKRFNTSEQSAERCLRYGKDFIKDNFAKKYKIKTKITIGSIINIFKFKIF